MKTILITGSTDGVGKLTATKLAKDGHQVLLHGRNSEKLERTLSEIKVESNNGNVKGFVSDLSDFRSIDKMVSELSKEFHSLDVLINNAGVFKSPKEKNQNNLDIRFAVNYFAPYLLTKKLGSLLKESSKPRVINLSSAAQSSFSEQALNGEESNSSQLAYAQSKLALTMWSFDFARAHPEIITIAVNPGSLLNTKMVQEAYGQFWSSADKGADILCELAVSEKHAENSGKYFDNDKGMFSDAHADAYSQEKINQLISTTDRILEL